MVGEEGGGAPRHAGVPQRRADVPYSVQRVGVRGASSGSGQANICRCASGIFLSIGDGGGGAYSCFSCLGVAMRHQEDRALFPQDRDIGGATLHVNSRQGETKRHIGSGVHACSVYVDHRVHTYKEHATIKLVCPRRSAQQYEALTESCA